MNRYLCVHGHFYQPPRENPWLNEVEIQDSAYPYHDWNEKITIECYAPNGASRILDAENKIIDIVNNYSKISFNFGPTLLSWMLRKKPDTYEKIIKADIDSQEKFSGHGSAIAQVYNHMIMPLANKRDKQTQIEWGIKDFEYRFQRKPEGMWLSETAVDLETLDLMADYGIKFTILSPHQAHKVKSIQSKEWLDASGGKIDPKQAYLCRLPSGKSINIFFYDGPVSQDIAFGGLLDNGDNFANRLIGTFSDNKEQPQLVHIATDGETYGHHHTYGEMALSYGLSHIAEKARAKITIYAEFLEKFPPVYEVRIIENSSWSCFHGIERWKSNCGCNLGTHSGWDQSWRVGLRKAMDWLRDTLAGIYEEQILKYLDDAWEARNDYINVILKRTPDSINEFLSIHSVKELTETEKTNVLRLLEMQRHAMLMYTSCGWFFDDVSGTEAMQIIHYAARAIQLARTVSGIDLEAEYLKILKGAKSNIKEHENAAKLYEKFVKTTRLDLKRVAAHYAVSSIFNAYDTQVTIYNYEIERKAYENMEAGKQRFITGSICIKSEITLEKEEFSYAVLHLGDHIIFGGICTVLNDEVFTRMYLEAKDAFGKSDVSSIISLFDKYFQGHDFSLWHVFRDEQRRIFTQMLTFTLKEIETSFRQINAHHYPIMLAMKQTNIPLPQVLLSTFSFIFNKDIKNALEQEDVDIKRIINLVKESKRWVLNIDKTTLGFVASKKISSLMARFKENPQDAALLKNMENLFKILRPLCLQMRIWEAQNIYFAVKKDLYDAMKGKAKQDDNLAKKWVSNFKALGGYLFVRSR
ncbi:MAG: DUF3536 domain-containing protein [Candidatus Omnitrophica bacterium]|nr:DUF3536 domain-containing protein [Candidatus Omnitrophota bacterium]